MLRELYFPGIAARSSSVTDEIAVWSDHSSQSAAVPRLEK
jgi:hypothetical protein